MAAFGMLAERVVVRPILGYPQFSIIMATIGLGYFLRSVVGMIWGTDDLKIETPFSTGVLKLGDLVIAHDKLSVIVATVIESGVGKRTLHRPEVCLPGQGWNITDRMPVTVKLAAKPSPVWPGLHRTSYSPAARSTDSVRDVPVVAASAASAASSAARRCG